MPPKTLLTWDTYSAEAELLSERFLSRFFLAPPKTLSGPLATPWWAGSEKSAKMLIRTILKQAIGHALLHAIGSYQAHAMVLPLKMLPVTEKHKQIFYLAGLVNGSVGCCIRN